MRYEFVITSYSIHYTKLYDRKLTLAALQIKEPQFEIYGIDGKKQDAPNKEELFEKLKPFV